MSSMKQANSRREKAWVLALATLCAMASYFGEAAAAHASVPADIQHGDGFLQATESRGKAQARALLRQYRRQIRLPEQDVGNAWSLNPIPTPYPTPVARNAQLVHEGFVYNFGGAFSHNAGDNTRYVGRAKLLDDSTVGPWQELTPLPMVLAMTSAVIHGDWVYVVGGYSSALVFRAPVLADGTFGEWQPQSGLPAWESWYGHQTLVVNDVLYAYGGWRNSSIYASNIDPEGNLGPWRHSGDLPVQLYSFAQAVWGSRLFLIGGKEIINDEQTIVATVRWIDLESDWPLGVWHETDPMPMAAWFHRTATDGPKVYVIGACGACDQLPPEDLPIPVLHGRISPDGSVQWSATSIPPVPMGFSEPGLVQDGGALHCFGGFTSNVIYNYGLTALTAALDIKPNHLNLKSNGNWLTGLLRPPAPYRASQIDVASIRLNGRVSACPSCRVKIEDHDTKLTVKFLRAEVNPTLTPGDHVPVDVTGLIAGERFKGTDYIKVKAAKIHKPKAGDMLAAGSSTEVVWDIADTPVPTVELLSSFDDGVTWSIEAHGIPNTGNYTWKVPEVTTDHGRLAVIQRYDTDETGVVPESEFAESDPFSIATPTGVQSGEAVLALRPSNPATGAFSVRFSLASTAAATLAVYDVSGRQAVSRDVGSSGPGWHTMHLGDLPAGIYVVRLSQAGRSLISRVAVIR